MRSKILKSCCFALFTISLLFSFQIQNIVVASILDGAVVILTFDKANMKLEGGKPVSVMMICQGAKTMA